MNNVYKSFLTKGIKNFIPQDFIRLLIIFALCLLVVFVATYIVKYGLADRILGDELHYLERSFFDPFTLVNLAKRLLFLVFALALALYLAISAFQLRVEAIILVLICLLPVFSIASINFPPSYVDSVGLVTAPNLTSIALVGSFMLLLYRDWLWFRKCSKTLIIRAMLFLAICGVFTQTYHLGIIDGLLLVFLRVIQPIIFIVLVSYVARSNEGLQNLFVSFVVSVLLAILIRVASPIPVDPGTGRAFAIGSWTIYGTILVAVLPLAITLSVDKKSIWIKIILVLIIPLMIFEVFLTQTRGAIAALAALGLFGLEKRFRWVAIVGSLLLVILLLNWEGNINTAELSGGRLLTLDIKVMMDDKNWISRLERNFESLQYIYSHPFSGLGLGRPTAETGSQLAYWVYNPYLAWGVSMGIPAMLAFVLVMYQAILNSLRNYFREQEKLKIYQLCIFISLVVWIVNQFTTGDSLTYLQSIESILFFYAVIGMVLGQSQTNSTNLIQ